MKCGAEWTHPVREKSQPQCLLYMSPCGLGKMAEDQASVCTAQHSLVGVLLSYCHSSI